MAKSNLGEGQIVQKVYDPNNEALRVVPVSGAIVTEAYDYIEVDYPSATQEVYTFKTGGAGGTVVATVTVNYTDSTKDFLDNVSRT